MIMPSLNLVSGIEPIPEGFASVENSKRKYDLVAQGDDYYLLLDELKRTPPSLPPAQGFARVVAAIVSLYQAFCASVLNAFSKKTFIAVKLGDWQASPVGNFEDLSY